MNEFLLNKELESVKNERENSRILLEASKEQMARMLKEQLQSVPYTVIPQRRKLPFRLRFKRFIDKVKLIIGFSHDT